jgi:hypothetical protein
LSIDSQTEMNFQNPLIFREIKIVVVLPDTYSNEKNRKSDIKSNRLDFVTPGLFLQICDIAINTGIVQTYTNLFGVCCSGDKNSRTI